jgi:DNA-binding beta-propeller fold protein YncE
MAEPALPATLAITADWAHHTLSLLDFDALIAKDPVAKVRVGTLDLSHYTNAPYTVKLTPDGKTALVTMSTGFFTVPGAGLLVNASTLPSGPSRVLFVDLATRTVTADLDTGDGASGIAITHDGSRAFVCHASSNNLTVLDVKARKILSQVDVGGTFAESIALDDTSTVGIVTYLDPATTQKSVRTFAVSDMASTLSTPISLGTDAAGVPFFPGTKTAFVVLAYNPLTSPASGYALIDATDPAAPKKLVQTMWTDTTYIAFDAIPAPARSSVLVPVESGGMLSLREYSLAASDVTLVKTYPVAPSTTTFGAFGLVIDTAGHVALTMPSKRQLAVLDLGSGATFTDAWFSEPSPLGIALRP